MRRILQIAFIAIGALIVGCMDDEITSPSPEMTTQLKSTLDEEPDETLDCHTCEIPEFPPADEFVSEITNRYFPLTPGTTFRYEGDSEDGEVEVVTEVTHDTKVILGVTTTVVRDREFVDDELVEETFDWFAQDEDGNVWYFGEFATLYEDGQEAGHEGSWEAGVDGAEPGIIMLGRPRNGMTYAQENAEGVAEDMARVVRRRKTLRIDYGSFRNVLVTKEWNPLEPEDDAEYKFYVRGVGLVLEAEGISDRGESLELIRVDGDDDIVVENEDADLSQQPAQ